MAKRTKAQRLAAVTSQIFGADIHPLAVAMARVNYLISIGSLLSEGDAVNIPIFWVDSLARLTSSSRSGRFKGFGVPVEIQIPGLRYFELPQPSEVSWNLILETTRELVRAKTGKTSTEEIWPRFTQELGEDIALRFEDTLRRFLTQVIDLHNRGRDMRWLPLLRNVLSIEGLKDKCKYVVGNPPWVRTHNIEEKFRKRINDDYYYCKAAGWERGCNLANISKGFGKQTDLCLPFVERSLELLKQDGKLGFVITSKIQQALYANVLRRDLGSNHTIIQIIDYSLEAVPLFVDAVNYPMIIAVQKTTPTPDSELDLKIHNLAGQVLETRVKQLDIRSLPDDSESPWLMAPANVVRILRALQRGSMLGSEHALRARMGVKAGATADYVITRLERTDRKGILLAENENGIRFKIEAELVYPLVRGEDVKTQKFNPKSWMIFPHDEITGKPLKSIPKEAEKYFSVPERKQRLEQRQDYKSSDPFWTIFRVSPDKLAPRAAWPEIATRMSACALPEYVDDELLGRKRLIPLQTVYLIPTENSLLLASVLNSTAFRAQMFSFAERARGAYFRHFSWTVGLGFVPSELAEPIRTGEKSKNGSVVEFESMLDDDLSEDKKIDLMISKLYGINKSEHKELVAYCEFVSVAQNAEPLFSVLPDSDVD
jgi:hypothetical protein